MIIEDAHIWQTQKGPRLNGCAINLYGHFHRVLLSLWGLRARLVSPIIYH
jgi:hypothetical protein